MHKSAFMFEMWRINQMIMTSWNVADRIELIRLLLRYDWVQLTVLQVVSNFSIANIILIC